MVKLTHSMPPAEIAARAYRLYEDSDQKSPPVSKDGAQLGSLISILLSGLALKGAS